MNVNNRGWRLHTHTHYDDHSLDDLFLLYESNEHLEFLFRVAALSIKVLQDLIKLQAMFDWDFNRPHIRNAWKESCRSRIRNGQKKKLTVRGIFLFVLHDHFETRWNPGRPILHALLRRHPRVLHETALDRGLLRLLLALLQELLLLEVLLASHRGRVCMLPRSAARKRGRGTDDGRSRNLRPCMIRHLGGQAWRLSDSAHLVVERLLLLVRPLQACPVLFHKLYHLFVGATSLELCHRQLGHADKLLHLESSWPNAGCWVELPRR